MKFNQYKQVVANTLRQNGIAGIRNIVFSQVNIIKEPRTMNSLPLIVQIEPTVNCNLKCKMCISPLLKRKNRTLTLDGFKHILAQFPYVQKISFVGTGEPLMNPDLFRIIRYARSKGIITGFATNATLMDKDTSAEIIALGTEWLNISLDGATKLTYEQIRVGAKFEVVLENIRNFMALLGNKKKPEVSIWFLAMKSNIAELPQFVSLVESLGIANIWVQTIHYWGSPEWKRNMSWENIGNEKGRLKNALSEAMKLARAKHINFSHINIPNKSGSRSCKWPWKSCYITTDGYITPCCFNGSNPELINFGNIFEVSFKDIWNNRAYQDFRGRLKSMVAPSICVDCTSYYNKI